MIILPILTGSLIQCWENVLFERRSETVNMKILPKLSCYNRQLGVTIALGNGTKITRRDATPRKYVFDVTSVGQRSSPWTCELSESRDKFHLECKLHFPSAQLILRQIHSTTVPASIEAKY